MTADNKNQFQDLPGATDFIQRDGWWMAAPGLDVVAAARLMFQLEGRLSTITAAA